MLNRNGYAKWTLITIITVAIAASLFLWKGNKSGSSKVSEHSSMAAADHPAGQGDSTPGLIPRNAASDETVAREPLSEDEQAELDMLRAMQARTVKAAIHAEPLDGEVAQRPEFVSEIEWEILNDLVAQNQAEGVSLSLLVNKMLFFKKRDAWMDSSTDPDTRRKLAGDLLAMIPGQLSDQSIDQSFADKMTDELNTFLQ